MSRFLGLALFVLAASSVAFASSPVVSAPELDGGTALTGLALLSGAVVVLRARFKR